MRPDRVRTKLKRAALERSDSAMKPDFSAATRIGRAIKLDLSAIKRSG
jgi:hypothetical protein